MTWLQGKKLDFAIIGAAKSSTSAVSDYLDLSDEIHIMKPKDGQVFMGGEQPPSWCGPGDEVVVDKMVRAREGYVPQLKSVSSGVKVADSSVFHMTSREAMLRLKASLEDDGFVIILLRRPDERAYSAYSHMVRDGLETESFKAAVELESQRKAAGWQPIWQYIGLGFYYDQVRAAFEVFGRDNVHVILFEDVTNDVVGSLRPVLERLGIEKNLGSSLYQVNSGGRVRSRALYKFLSEKNFLKDIGKRFVSRRLWLAVRTKLEVANLDRGELSRADGEWLSSIFEQDVLKLQSLIGRDLSGWLVP
ncbi:MAG: hypothetical protein V7738_18095 [Dietzia maris]